MMSLRWSSTQGRRPPRPASGAVEKGCEVTMPANVNDKVRSLPSSQRRKVEARAAELIAEEMTLRELRKARKLTQVRLARTLKINQDSVSRLERRSDLL